ncbi:MAG TPA: hypothetical protein VG734_02865 [Lacunisphaera sp.]|nr:hypothetical protein [Lacunisphaera sp.]
MILQSPCVERPGPNRVDVELFLKQCDQPRLETLLRTVQQRLGSPAERLGDVDCAQMIVHQMNNLLTVRRVNEIMRQLDESGYPPSPPDRK